MLPIVPIPFLNSVQLYRIKSFPSTFSHKLFVKIFAYTFYKAGSYTLIIKKHLDLFFFNYWHPIISFHSSSQPFLLNPIKHTQNPIPQLFSPYFHTSSRIPSTSTAFPSFTFFKTSYKFSPSISQQSLFRSISPYYSSSDPTPLQQTFKILSSFLQLESFTYLSSLFPFSINYLPNLDLRSYLPNLPFPSLIFFFSLPHKSLYPLFFLLPARKVMLIRRLLDV